MCGIEMFWIVLKVTRQNKFRFFLTEFYIELKENLSGAGGKPFLEQIMIDWATRNDPDQVDDTILQKIHEVAGLLGELVATKRPVPSEKGMF